MTMRKKIVTLFLTGLCSASMVFGCVGTTAFAQKGSSDSKKSQTSKDSDDKKNSKDDSKSDSKKDSKDDSKKDSKDDSKKDSKSSSKSGSGSSSKSKSKDYGDAEEVLAEAFETIYDSECIGLSGTSTVTYDDGEEALFDSYILADDSTYIEVLSNEDNSDIAYLVVAYENKKSWDKYIIPAGGAEDDITIDEVDFGDLEESGYSIAVGTLADVSSAEWEEGSEGETIEAEIDDYDLTYTADLDDDSRIERIETSNGEDYEIYYDEEIQYIVKDFLNVLDEMEPDDGGYIESFREGIESSDEYDYDDDYSDYEVDGDKLGTYVDTPIYWLEDLVELLDEDDYSYDEVYEALEALDGAVEDGLDYYSSDASGMFSAGYDDNAYAKVKKGKTATYILLFYIPETDSYGQIEVTVKNTTKSDQYAIDCEITGYSVSEE
jgi:hypothetical protein